MKLLALILGAAVFCTNAIKLQAPTFKGVSHKERDTDDSGDSEDHKLQKLFKSHKHGDDDDDDEDSHKHKHERHSDDDDEDED